MAVVSSPLIADVLEAPRSIVATSQCPPTRVSRPAGSFEKFCIIREELKLYKHTVVAASYSRPHAPTGLIGRDAILKALKQCITQHHALCTVVHSAHTEAPKLVQAARMDLRLHMLVMDAVHGAGAEVIKQFLLSAHNLAVPSEHPPWRAVVLPVRSQTEEKFLVALVCSHAIMDGRSAFVFHQTFLQALRNVATLNFDLTPALDPPSNYNLAPEMNDGGKLSVSRAYITAALEAKARRDQPSLVEENPTWTGASSRPDVLAFDFHPMSLEVVVIPNATVTAAVQACRLHGARLTGLLNHLTAHAILRALRKRGQHYNKMLAFTPYDLRKLLGQGPDTMANLVSSVNETIEVNPELLGHESLTSADWDKIRTTTDLLRERSMSYADQPVALLGYLSSYRDYFLHLAKSPPKESFSMSNLGLIDGSADGKDQSAWKIDDAIFSQSSFAAGAALLFNVASSKNGPLNMTVTWWPGVLGVGDNAAEHAFIQDVTADIVLHLESVGR